MSEMENKVNETTEMNQVNDQAPATEQPKTEEPAKEKKDGFLTKAKRFGKEKVLPVGKAIGKGVVTGASMAGAALGTAYLIGLAIGGYTTATAKKDDAETTDDNAESSTEEKPADQTDDVKVSLNENNVNVDSNIE